MTLKNPSVGEYYTPAYQMSGIPFVTSSIVNLGQIKEVVFSHISKFVTIKNHSISANTLALSFTSNGLATSKSNYFILSGSESITTEVKTDRIFISGSTGASVSFSVLAGLTVIPSAAMLPVTGSNGYSGVG